MTKPPDFVKFARAILDGWPEYGVEMDGGELQELATECGLLVPTTATESCEREPDRFCHCAEDGATFPTTCYRRVPEMIGGVVDSKKSQ